MWDYWNTSGHWLLLAVKMYSDFRWNYLMSSLPSFFRLLTFLSILPSRCSRYFTTLDWNPQRFQSRVVTVPCFTLQLREVCAHGTVQHCCQYVRKLSFVPKLVTLGPRVTMTDPERKIPFRNGTVCFTTADFFLSSTSDLEWHILFLRTHVSRAWCCWVCADKIHVSWCCYPTIYGDTIKCKSTLSRDDGSEQASRPGHFSCSVETNLTGGCVGQRVNLNVEEKNKSIFFAGNWIRIVWSPISYDGERSDFH